MRAFDVSSRVLAALAIPGFAAWMMSPAHADEPLADAKADAAVEGGASAEAASAPVAAAPVEAGTPEAATASPQQTPPVAVAPSPEGGAPKPLEWDEKLSFGIRAEYAFPVGTATQTPLSDIVAGAFQIGGELGYQIVPRWSVLVYFFYGFPSIAGGASTTCNDPTLQCSANLIRFGAEANYHFRSRTRLVDPWLGLGLGYEILNETSADDTGATLNAISLNGFELSSAFGAEFRPGGNFGLGPYVQASLGHYFSDVSPPAFHGWLTLGLQLRMGP